MQGVKLTLKTENDKNIIYVEGRIDSVNHVEFKEELFSYVEKVESHDYEIDMEGLEYISSSGLRVLLLLAKSQKEKVHVINVKPDIAEIFKTTGFDKILDVKKMLREVSVEGCEMIGRGGTGSVYRIDRETVIKVYKEGTDDSIIWKEREMARQCFISGIPTAIPYDVVKSGNSKGIVFEMIRSDTLAEMMNNHPENMERYVEEYVELMRKIHTTSLDTKLFPSAKELYRVYFEFCRDYFNDEEYEMMNGILDSLPEGNNMVHGDFHPRNIMVNDGELMLIDMGGVCYGHPIFDFIAMTVALPVFAREDQELASHYLGIKGEMIIPFWFDILRKYFKDENEAKIKKLDELLCTIGRIKRLVLPMVEPGITEEMTTTMMNDARNTLFPKYDMLTQYDWKSLFDCI